VTRHTRRSLAGIALLVLAASPVQTVSPQPEALMFVADLQGKLVAPGAVETAATAKATGVLIGNRFTVHGSFSALSSPLRDLEKKPDDPGVHLHRGAPGETTPYFHGLQVRLNSDGRSGIFFGAVTLDNAQMELLLAGRTYVDIHTVKYGPGEVRDQWRPVNPAAARAASTSLQARSAGGEVSITTARCH
jgi:hypothetical protein